MKKLMSVMLGLSLVLGSVSLFAADEKPATDKKETKKKTKKPKKEADKKPA